MKLFVNDEIWKRNEDELIKCKQLANSRLKLTIPDDEENEKIRFVFPDVSEEDLEKDLLLDNISLKRTGKNTYNFIKSTSRQEKNLFEFRYNERYMYALLRGNGICDDDIFIPASMKDKVQVLRKMWYVYNDDFDSNVYFIKIILDSYESLPIYLTESSPHILEEHYVFSKTECLGLNDYNVTEKLKTRILLNEKNKADFISLSTLCE